MAVGSQPRKSRKAKAKTKPTAAQIQTAPAPAPAAPPPLTPEQGPSSPPEVSFQGGQLTILARNSTMSDILNAVKQRTGAAVEMPPVSSERVVGKFGPGAPRDVMAQLLNGSHYDYVLVGAPSDPGVLKKVVLMARASGPEQTQAQQSPQNVQPNPNLQAVPDVESEQNPEENANEVPPEAQQQEEEPQPDQQGGQQNGPTVKTPEQLLRELQQQQQQQQQEQQNAPPPGAPGQPPQ
jgi:hypothetical protein